MMGVGSLAFVYASAGGYDVLVRGLLAFGAFWLYAGWRRWTWASAVGILLLVALAGFGLWNSFSTGWLIAGALGGLMAWDMGEFLRRMHFAPESDEVRDLERRHLARLVIVAVVGTLLASIAMLITVEFTLEWMMLMALVGVLGLTQLVIWLRRR